MLNERKVLLYVSKMLGLPYSFVEIHTDEILQIIKEFTIPYFSTFRPDGPVRVTITQNNKIAPNTYKIEDPDGRQIIDVIRLHPSFADVMMHGYELAIMPKRQTAIDLWILNFYDAEMAHTYSPKRITWKFRPPNMLDIITGVAGFTRLVAEYVRTHADNFETIPPSIERYFLDLAVADVMEYLDAIRSEYTELSTPFGNVPVRQLTDVVEKFRNRALEKLQTLPPYFVVDVR